MAKSSKSMSLFAKIILVILFDIYGLLRRLESKKLITKILGIIIFLTGSLFGIILLIDLICVLISKDIKFIK